VAVARFVFQSVLLFHHRQHICLLVQQALDHFRMRQHHHLPHIESARLPQYFAKQFVADGLDALQEAAALAGGARIAQQVLEALARALAGHLDQTQRRYSHHLGLRTIQRQRLM
jgi:hypothetical protein